MVFTIPIFGVAFWLGLYLINRDLHSPRLRYGGLGLLAYALAWGCTILSSYAPTPAFGLVLTRWSWSFFALSMGLLLFPQVWPLHPWIMFLVGIDFLVLGGVIIVLDAFDQGEALLPDIFRSFDFSLGAVALFAGQVLVVILLSTGLTFP